MHLSDHDLAIYLDPPHDAIPETVHGHLEQCAACRNAVSWARTTDHRIAALLDLLDYPARPIAFAAIEGRAIRGKVGHFGDPSSQPAASGSTVDDLGVFLGGKARRGYRPAVRWGLVGLAFAAAAAAAAVPKSPVRQFLASWVVRREHIAAAPSAPGGTDDLRQSGAQAASRGLAILPRTGQVVLIWRVPQSASVIEVRTASPGSSQVGRVSLVARGDGAIYAVSHDTIVVDNRSAPGVTFQVDLPPPSELASVTLRLGDHVVFRRRGNTLETHAVRARDGSYSIALTADQGP
jgi:hypothetical protein